MFKIGDLVTRKSYNNDTVFKIVDMISDTAFLKGVDVRLCADCEIADMELYQSTKTEDEDEYIFNNVRDSLNLDRSQYFYLPGKILHIDGDTSKVK